MGTSGEDYLFGYSQPERDRLEMQASVVSGLTKEFLLRAGISPGMRILDVGCGMGDVSLMLARMVGPSGAVLGMDRDRSGVERGAMRARAEGLTNVNFSCGELPLDVPEMDFDALVGRMFLMYFSEPGVALRSMVRAVRPGGIVAFLEPDLASTATYPSVPSVADNVLRQNALFGRNGFRARMGLDLPRSFSEAGLKAEVVGTTKIEQDGNGVLPAWFAESIRSLVPAMSKAGLATERDIDAGTLEARMRSETNAVRAVVMAPTMYGAWATVPSAG